MKNLNFREVISLFYHASCSLSKNMSNDDELSAFWKKLLDDFLKDLEKQNKFGWPVITVNRNSYRKRIDVIDVETPFVVSNNILILLIRLIYIENYKRPYINKSDNYHKILGMNLQHELIKSEYIENITLADIIDSLKLHLVEYMKIYSDDKKIEYQLSKNILAQLTTDSDN